MSAYKMRHVTSFSAELLRSKVSQINYWHVNCFGSRNFRPGMKPGTKPGMEMQYTKIIRKVPGMKPGTDNLQNALKLQIAMSIYKKVRERNQEYYSYQNSQESKNETEHKINQYYHNVETTRKSGTGFGNGKVKILNLFKKPFLRHMRFSGTVRNRSWFKVYKIRCLWQKSISVPEIRSWLQPTVLMANTVPGFRI